jgi:hypothetical protein
MQKNYIIVLLIFFCLQLSASLVYIKQREKFSEYLRKAEFLKQRVPATETTQPPEKIIYEFALQLVTSPSLL